MRNRDSEESAGIRPSRYPWPPILLAATLAAAWGLDRIFPIAWPGLDDTAARVAGYVLLISGVGILLWAVLTLRAARTTVLPTQSASALVTSGPYRFRRHPIYLAEMLILLGLAELTKIIWIAILVPVFAALIIWLAILPEEQHLEVKFGQAYRDYKARTRMLI
jgi:protein-S-isoprenylcysteine O-methyltransferase Ste14